MWLLKPLPVRPPFVGSRSAGFFPSPAVRLVFSRGGESTLHFIQRKKSWLLFSFTIIAGCIKYFNHLLAWFWQFLRITSIVFREICVCELVLDEETRWTCACTGYDALSACEPFFSENSGWTRFLLNAVLHYITCAVDDVDAICPNFQDETGTTCRIFTWLPRNLSRFNLRPCM